MRDRSAETELPTGALVVSPFNHQVAIDGRGIVRAVGNPRQILTDMISAYQEARKHYRKTIAAQQTALVATLMAMPTTTRIPVTRWAFAPLALALLGVVGCTNSSTGSPLPTSPTESSEAPSSSPPTSTENAADKLAAIDPCSLLTQAQLDQYGLHKQDSGNLAGARQCAWGRKVDANGKGGFVVGPAIWDRQGLKDINTDGQIVTDTMTIGRHQARQAKQTHGDACFVAIGVTDSSRVDVVASGDPGQGCVLANQFAKLIEPQLPGGSE